MYNKYMFLVAGTNYPTNAIFLRLNAETGFIEFKGKDDVIFNLK
jgi:hypothetical protein